MRIVLLFCCRLRRPPWERFSTKCCVHHRDAASHTVRHRRPFAKPIGKVCQVSLGPKRPFLVEFGRTWRSFDRFRPSLAECGPILARIGQFGPNVGQHWPNLARMQPNSANSGRNLSTLDQIRPNLDQIGPLGPSVGRNLVNVGQHLAASVQLRSIRANSGPISGKIWPRLLP